jgi:SAM-dependent methyltransferase
MESAEETNRLLAQEAADLLTPKLLAIGLKTGARVLDAGCGPGTVTQEIGQQVGQSGSVLGIDLSDERIAIARTYNKLPNVRFLVKSINDTGLPRDTFDLCWSQYVFEYLASPELALNELVRVTKPGGKIAISDIDGVGLDNWPFPEEVERGYRLLLSALAPTGIDLFIGRKLFHLFCKIGLTNVRVHLFPFYVHAGAADPRTIADWTVRFNTLGPLVEDAFGGVDRYERFYNGYLSLLSRPDALKYGVVLVTEGIKP